MAIGGDGVAGPAAQRLVMKEGKQGLNSFVNVNNTIKMSALFPTLLQRRCS